MSNEGRRSISFSRPASGAPKQSAMCRDANTVVKPLALNELQNGSPNRLALKKKGMI